MSYEADETYDVYDETPRRARTEKHCDACQRAIAPGEIYMRVFTVIRGPVDTIARCGSCQATHVHLRNLDVDMWPHERLSCGLSYQEEWGALPDDVAALAFATNAEASKRLEADYAELARRRAFARHCRARAQERAAESSEP